MPQPPLNDQYTQMGWVSAAQCYVAVGGKPAFIENSSLRITNAIGQRSTCAFTLDDTQGTVDYLDGELVQVFQAGSQNLLLANQSDIETGISGFSTAVDALITGTGTATIAQDPTRSWQGNYSLHMNTGANGGAISGVEVNPGVALPAGAQVTVSLYYWTTLGSDSLALRFYDFTNLNVPAGGIVFGHLSGWQRWSYTYTQTLATSDLRFAVRCSIPNIDVWLDAFQVEIGSNASVWALGAGGNSGLMFAGPLADSKRSRIGLGANPPLYPIQCTAADWHYLADKRIVALSYQYQTCGYMVQNLIDTVLSAEGVTYQRGINVLSAQQSAINSSNMAPFIPINSATLSQDTTPANVVSGVGGALKVVTPGVNNFEGVNILTPVAQLTPGATYTLSAWMKASTGTPTIRFFCVNDGGGTVGNQGSVTLSTTYTRYQFAVTLPSSFAGRTGFGFAIDTGAVHQAITFWCDDLQMELGPAASAWALGGTGNNLLSANQSSVETNTTGFATLGTGTVTITRDNAEFYSGTASLKVVADGSASGQGAKAALPAGSFLANGAYTFSVWLWGTGTVRLYVRDETAGAQLTGSPAQTIVLGQFWQRAQVTVTMPSSLNVGGYSLVVDDNNVATALTWWEDGLQIEHTVASNWELGGLIPSIQAGPTVINYNAPYVPASKMMDDLAQLAGFYWQIDQNKVAWFLLPTTLTAPFVYDGTQGIYGQQSVETASPLYRNSQWLLNIPDVTSPQTETRKGDGTTHSFTMSYPFNTAPFSVVLNGGTYPGTVTAYGATRYYRLDESSGTTVFDTSGQGQNGTLGGTGTTLSSPGLLTGDSDTAYLMAGNTNEGVSSPTTGLPTGNAPWSMAIWFKVAGYGGANNYNLLSLGTTVTNEGVTLYVAGGGKLSVAPTNGTVLAEPAVVPTGVAHFGAVTWDGTTMTLYQDNLAPVTMTPGALAITYAGGGFFIGEWFTGNGPLVGTMDEAQFYPTALTALQIGRLYAQGSKGAAQTVGVKGVDDQTHSKDWYFTPGDPTLAQDSNDVTLTPTDSLVVTYIGRWISNIYSQSPSLVAQRSALDGTSGIVEEAHNDPTITTSAAGFSLAAALLARYGVQGKQIVFQTRVGGLAPGQMLTVSMISAGWRLSNAQALIEQVQITVSGQWYVYTVTAIIGPFDQNWVQFYQKLAGVGNLVPGSVGSNQNIQLLQSQLATWAWAATFTATVFACPICAPATLCGPSVKVC